LRKGIKIKASLIILSWLMIMAHNIIPHNHHENDFCKLNEHFRTQGILNDEFHTQGNHYEVCRIAGLLFHQLSHDDLFPEKNNNEYLFSALREDIITDNNKHFFYSHRFSASVSLRAPPAA